MSDTLRETRGGAPDRANRDLRIDAADLVATAGAGCRLGDLHEALALQGVWLALDPPAPAGSALGEVLESGAPGPLAAAFGAPRDQVLGAAFEAGAGTVARTGGRVVKNVAGFDLAKLLVGGRGAFGRLREVHLRLRARPQADRTRAWSGAREVVAAATGRLMREGAMLAACEVVSPPLAESSGLGAHWTLLARAMGSAAGLAEELDAAAAMMTRCAETAVPDDVWARWRDAVCGWKTVVRIGADPSAWSEAVALAEDAGGVRFSVTVPRGTVRAAFAAGAGEAIRRLRAAVAPRGWPVTIERADAATIESAGIWGELNAGTLRLTRALRAAMDPGGAPALWT